MRGVVPSRFSDQEKARLEAARGSTPLSTFIREAALERAEIILAEDKSRQAEAYKRQKLESVVAPDRPPNKCGPRCVPVGSFCYVHGEKRWSR